MEGPFGRGNSIRFQCGGRNTDRKRKLGSKERVKKKQQPTNKQSCLPLKAGTGKHKDLSLDPQRNQHHHQPQQNPILNSSHIGVEVGAVEEEVGKNQENLFSQQHHQYLQQTQSQEQQLYASLDTQVLQEFSQPSKKRSFGSKSTEHARKMGDSHHQAATSSRLGIRHSGGEIVEVQGGHIVRSTGRKDRHSKVCTAKGPRDRRVRLSAHTAIQFYDVQDRLGYDRPSKAVDWLIRKAKPAIDELSELPPWKPETTLNTTTTTSGTKPNNNQEEQNTANNDKPYQFHIHHGMENLGGGGGAGSGTRRRTATIMGNEVQSFQQQEMGDNPNNTSGFLPPSLVSDEIADTIKSFFPLGASSETHSSSIQFQNYPLDLLSRSSHSQDLRLSLHSLPEPILLHQHHQAATSQTHNSQPVLLSGTSPLGGFDGSSAGWEHHHQHPGEIGRFQRLVAWNTSGADTGSSSGGGAAGGSGGGVGGFIFGTSQPQPLPSPSPFAQNSQFFSQRGPLQSSNTPLVRAWIDQPISLTDEHQHQHHHHHQIPQSIHHQAALSSIGFTTSGVFSGYRIPARIQGEEEEHDSIANKLSSASSDSHH